MKALAVALGIALLCRAATSVCAQQGPQFVLSLAQALDLAKRDNLYFQAAQQDVRAAQARVLQAGATLLPSLSSSYSCEHRQSPTVLRLPLPPASGAAEPGLNVPLSFARAAVLPLIAIGAQPSLFGIPQPVLTATLSATWRLFDGGLSRGRIAEADAQITKAGVNLAQLRNAVDLEAHRDPALEQLCEADCPMIPV